MTTDHATPRGPRVLRAALFIFALATAGAALPSGPARADIMDTCTAEIGAHCSDVRRGRGRIAACLYANSEKLSGPCAADVSDLSSSGSVSRMVPAGITELQGTPYEADLREACSGDATRLCSGVNTGDARILLCFYARETQLSADCRSTGKRVLDQIK